MDFLGLLTIFHFFATGKIVFVFCVYQPYNRFTKSSYKEKAKFTMVAPARLALSPRVTVQDRTLCDVNTQMVVKSPHADTQMAP